MCVIVVVGRSCVQVIMDLLRGYLFKWKVAMMIDK